MSPAANFIAPCDLWRVFMQQRAPPSARQVANSHTPGCSRRRDNFENALYLVFLGPCFFLGSPGRVSPGTSPPPGGFKRRLSVSLYALREGGVQNNPRSPVYFIHLPFLSKTVASRFGTHIVHSNRRCFWCKRGVS